MTAVVEAPEFTPGIYPDMPAEVYHADPVPGGSLSSTGARKLLPPSTPAKFKWWRDNEQPPKSEFEIGTAAHRLVLGDGPELVCVTAKDWRSNAVKEEVAAIRATGAVPLKPDDYQRVHDMAAAVRRHPLAAALFNPDHGRPEQSLFCPDPATGVWRRARLDWLPEQRSSRLLIPDYKTTKDASNTSFSRAIDTYGYHQQAAWYVDCANACGVAGPDAEFLFVAQEKEPPYLVNVIGISSTSLRIGRAKNRRAMEKFAECQATGIWTGYGDEPNYLSLPPYAEIRDTEEYL